jgi:hypothetical protein
MTTEASPALIFSSIFRMDDTADNHVILDLTCGQKLALAGSLARSLDLRKGDKVWFKLGADRAAKDVHLFDSVSGLLIIKSQAEKDERKRKGASCVWYGYTGYVSEPRPDKQENYFVRVRVSDLIGGLEQLFVSCRSIQDYFYRLWRHRAWEEQPQTWFEALGVSPRATAAEIVLGYKLRRLELLMKAEPNDPGRYLLDRSFDLLSTESTRRSVHRLLEAKTNAQPREKAPTRFPYHGYGYLTAGGHLSADGRVLFVHRIYRFRPIRKHYALRISLADFHFTDRTAVYREESGTALVLASHQLPFAFDGHSNQWKHYLDIAVDVEADFILTGRFAKTRSGAWQETRWMEPIPSTLCIRLDPDYLAKIEAARTVCRRIGQAAQVVSQIRTWLSQRLLSLDEIRTLLVKQGFGDLEPYQVIWQAGHDPFYFHYLNHKAEATFVYGEEFIFVLKDVVVIEFPGRGHATYFFRRPRNIEAFLRNYGSCHREAIIKNIDQAGEKLGFISRINHRPDRKEWAQQVEEKLATPRARP